MNSQLSSLTKDLYVFITDIFYFSSGEPLIQQPWPYLLPFAEGPEACCFTDVITFFLPLAWRVSKWLKAPFRQLHLISHCLAFKNSLTYYISMESTSPPFKQDHLLLDLIFLKLAHKGSFLLQEAMFLSTSHLYCQNCEKSWWVWDFSLLANYKAMLFLSWILVGVIRCLGQRQRTL